MKTLIFDLLGLWMSTFFPCPDPGLLNPALETLTGTHRLLKQGDNITVLQLRKELSNLLWKLFRQCEILKYVNPSLTNEWGKKRLPGFLFDASLRIRRVVMPHNCTNKKYCSQLIYKSPTLCVVCSFCH